MEIRVPTPCEQLETVLWSAGNSSEHITYPSDEQEITFHEW